MGYLQRVRIIGGCWRSRWITVPQVVRPSPGRIRETLFNWLRDAVQGARCLDAFAGSGVLGFEALSRGAASVVFCDHDPQVLAHLAQNRDRLLAQEVMLHNLSWQSENILPFKGSFDLVFLDPPFAQDMLTLMCKQLVEAQLLSSSAWVYCEWRVHPPIVPKGWTLWRQARAGKVQVGLYRVQANASGG